MKRILFCALAAVVLTMALANFAQAVVIASHSGNNDPEDEGWTYASSGDTVSSDGSNISDEKTWRIDSVPGAVKSTGNYVHALTGEDVGDATGWTATFRARQVKAPDSTYDTQVLAQVQDGADWWMFKWYSSPESTSTPGTYKIDTPWTPVLMDSAEPGGDSSKPGGAVHHWYQIVYDPKEAGTADDLATYYVDGSAVGTQDRAGAVDTALIQIKFGDQESRWEPTDSRWSCAVFETGQHPGVYPCTPEVPEPSTLVLLIAAGLGLALWGWWRRR